MGWTGIQMYWYLYDQATAVLHTFTGILFLGFALVHLWNNLKPLKGYLLKRRGQWNVQPYFNNRLSLELNISAKDLEFIVSRPKIQLFRTWVDS